jgi:hypothetical protein
LGADGLRPCGFGEVRDELAEIIGNGSTLARSVIGPETFSEVSPDFAVAGSFF